jgi:hypothetical protein
MRKANLSPLEQAAKEWLLWAVYKWMGPEGGARWLYTVPILLKTSLEIFRNLVLSFEFVPR